MNATTQMTQADQRTSRFKAVRRMRTCQLAAAVLFAQTLASGAAAAPMSFQALAQRLPAASNVVVAINAKQVLNSAYGKREHWAANAADAWAKQPVMIPPGATKLIMAASVKPSNMESYWEMSLIEMDKMPTIQELADKEGGHIDRVWDKDAVYSPINAYFVPIEPTVLASITPAERSEIGRWVRQPVKPEGVVTSDFIRNVVAGLSDKTDIVMAMDLEGAYGLPNIRKFIDDSDIKEIPADKVNAVAQVLETLKGITLQVTVGENVDGRVAVAFDRDAAVLNDCAKPLMVAVLQRAGLRTDDVQNWKFSAAGKEISMQGSLSASGLRELMAMVQSPVAAATTTVAAGTTEGGTTGGATTQPAAASAAASQRYYKTIATCVKSLEEGASVKATGTTFRNTAKRIDQLPILGVDPELVEWGNMVAARLKEASAVLGVGQQQMNARVQGVRDPEYVTYNYDRTGAVNTNAGALNDAASKEKRQAAAQQKSETYQRALGVLSELPAATAKIRSEMVAKYNVEF